MALSYYARAAANEGVAKALAIAFFTRDTTFTRLVERDNGALARHARMATGIPLSKPVIPVLPFASALFYNAASRLPVSISFFNRFALVVGFFSTH